MNKQAKKDQAEQPTHVFRRHENGSWIPNKLVPGESVIELSPKVYEPCLFEEGMSKKLGIFEIDQVKPPKTVYGNIHSHVDRYFRTYERNDKNLGVMLIGQAGSGKTTTARCATETSLGMGMPVIMINSILPPEALFALISSIQQNCTVIFDEVDKTYGSVGDTDENAELYHAALLRVLDGSVGGGKKLYFLIGNQRDKLSPYLFNRPSRIRYTRYFQILPLDVLLPYVRDNLKGCRELDLLHFKKYRDFSGGILNFDMMAAIVDEMNTYKLGMFEAAVEMFGDVGLLMGGANFGYLVEAKKPDGTTTDHEGIEGKRASGYCIELRADITGQPPVETLMDCDFKSFGPEQELLYEKNGVTYTLYPEYSDYSGEKKNKDLFNQQMSWHHERLIAVQNRRYANDERHQQEIREKSKQSQPEVKQLDVADEIGNTVTENISYSNRTIAEAQAALLQPYYFKIGNKGAEVPGSDVLPPSEPLDF